MYSEERRPSAALPPGLCESLVDALPVGFCIVQDGNIVYANRWLRETGGSQGSTAAPWVARSLFHPEDQALVSRQLQLAGPDAAGWRTARLVTRSGGVCVVELHSRRIELHGRPAIQSTLVDVSARTEEERILKADVARLEESDRSRKLFGDIVSHDLMNPVWIAENYLRLVTDEGVPDDKRTFYEGLRGALAKARRILADARTFLSLQDLATLTGEQTDLRHVVETVAQSLRPLAEQKGQTIGVTCAGVALVDASPLIREVVSQFIANAIKFGPADSLIEVAVSGAARVRLEVRDRGAGVPEAGRRGIFQRFERLEKGPITGIGLGLAIVRRIVDLHGGWVWVEENPGGGSTFIAEFPASR